MPPPNDRLDYVQFSIRTLLVLMTIMAVLISLIRFVCGLVDDPLSFFAAIAVGLTVGLVTGHMLEKIPFRFIFGIAAVAFVLMNSFWFSGNFLAYSLGIVAGGLMAWKGLDALNLLFWLCGVTISTVRRPPPGQ